MNQQRTLPPISARQLLQEGEVGGSIEDGVGLVLEAALTERVTNTYFGSKLIGRRVSGSYTSVVTDRLNSIGKYYPYGQEKGTVTPNDQEKFATYTRDSVSGLDYANQRYYQPGAGRFLTPDPYKASASVTDPNTWNRYAYAQGDPIKYSDPSGTLVADPDDWDAGGWYWFDILFYGGGWGGWDGWDGGGTGDEEPEPPPLQCNFDGMLSWPPTGVTSTPQGEAVNGFFLPVSLTFSATGGTDSFSWNNTQTANTTGSENRSGTILSATTSRTESLSNHADNPAGAVAVLFDTPGLVRTTSDGTIVSAVVIWNFSLQVWVSSGGQTTQCPTVWWQAVEVWQNGTPSFGSAYVVQP